MPTLSGTKPDRDHWYPSRSPTDCGPGFVFKQRPSSCPVQPSIMASDTYDFSDQRIKGLRNFISYRNRGCEHRPTGTDHST